jgi:hypothetical protein
MIFGATDEADLHVLEHRCFSPDASLVLDNFDFSRFRSVVQIGGGDAILISHVLVHHQHVRGVLFDAPAVVRAGRRYLTLAGVNERCAVLSGSALVSVPAGGDLYVLSHVIQHWGDTASLRILGNCRKAMGADGRLLLVERMLTFPTRSGARDGRARTEAQYAALLAVAGLMISRIIDTGEGVQLIEARVA